MQLTDTDGMANSVDPDQTAPEGAQSVYPDLSLRKLRNITVRTKSHKRGKMFNKVQGLTSP